MTAGPTSTPSLAAGTGQPPRRRSTRTVAALTAAVGLAWLALDQVTKALAVALLEVPGRVVDLGLMDLRVIRNPGGAFGVPGFPGMFVLVSVVVLTLVVRALPRTERLTQAAAYGLVTGGAVGNLVDRLVRAPGFPSGAVVDFFDLRWWPVFNVADIGIVTGALAIAVLLTIEERQEREAGSPSGDAAAVPDDEASARR